MSITKKVIVTGANGFIGNHLVNHFNQSSDLEVIGLNRTAFSDDQQLSVALRNADVVVHLAAVNRHENQQELFNLNIAVVKRLIHFLEIVNSKAHVLFSSSTQITRDNLYGLSKKEGGKLLADWAIKAKAIATSIVVPNVFGPFCKPNYNSFVATFCHSVATGNTIEQVNSAEVDLIYVDELCKSIIGLSTDSPGGLVHIEPTYRVNVTDVHAAIVDMHNQYTRLNTIPSLVDSFERNLFNTYRSYLPFSRWPIDLTKHSDQRGTFAEVVRLQSGGQYSFSTTNPGFTRGNHYHTRKMERFTVIKGEAEIALRQIGSVEVHTFQLSGEKASYVDMPVWYTHNLKNIGTTELLTLFYINEPFDQEDPDTYFVEV